MGQAKLRGTREERVAAAIEKREFEARQRHLAEMERRQQLAEIEAKLPAETREKLNEVRKEATARRARLIGNMVSMATGHLTASPLRDAMARNAAYLGAAMADQQARQQIVDVISSAPRGEPVHSFEIAAHDEVEGA